MDGINIFQHSGKNALHLIEIILRKCKLIFEGYIYKVRLKITPYKNLIIFGII